MTSLVHFLNSWWPLITGILGFVGTLLGFREYFLLPRKARQELLDRLPDPQPRGWADIQRTATLDEQREFVFRNGLDLASLNSRLSSPPRQIHRALRSLVAHHKVGIFILRGVNEAGHPDIPAGSVGILPIIFKGALPPELRSPPDQIEWLLTNL